MNTHHDANTILINPKILYFPTQQQARLSDYYVNEKGKTIVSRSLHIKNSSDNTIVFKILCKSNSLYAVRPVMGFLGKGEQTKIGIHRDAKTLSYDVTTSCKEFKVHLKSLTGLELLSDVNQLWNNVKSQKTTITKVDVGTQVVKDMKLLSNFPIIEFGSPLQALTIDNIFAKISPSSIQFTFPRHNNSVQQAASTETKSYSVVRLQNLYHSRIAFKVMITHADRYIVKPNEGFIDVGSFREISIFLLAKTIPHGTESCEDKFKILLGPASDVAKGYQGEIRFNCQINAVSPHLIRDDAGPSVVKDERVQTEKDESYFPDTMREKRRESTNNRSVGNNDTNEVMGRNVNGRSVRGSDVSRRSAVEEEETASDMLERLMAERYKETERLESQRTQI